MTSDFLLTFVEPIDLPTTQFVWIIRLLHPVLRADCKLFGTGTVFSVTCSVAVAGYETSGGGNLLLGQRLLVRETSFGANAELFFRSGECPQRVRLH